MRLSKQASSHLVRRADSINFAAVSEEKTNNKISNKEYDAAFDEFAVFLLKQYKKKKQKEKFNVP